MERVALSNYIASENPPGSTVLVLDRPQKTSLSTAILVTLLAAIFGAYKMGNSRVGKRPRK